MYLNDPDSDMPNATYEGPDRRGERHLVLTDDQLDKIAEKAAEKAVAKITDHVYKQVGKGLINKLVWVLGAFGTGAYLWLHSKGLMK
jgi:hypothetical protein